ncbi:restriction endonuclease subunit S [Snodgrassella alvi]|uniref:Restriction endonuclease subunit S n=1 Tax=Snodgrassella alvi TaxID=1196083 RepID=A0A2N9WQZ4_9NEIS|nr:restriction endonuclease subunit S [Snodgrassella alvi]PIT12283.1 restriction endonuclease subunit S [Snodgrassella alvi]
MSKLISKRIDDLAFFNPSEKIVEGQTLKKIPMENLNVWSRKITGFVLGEYKSGSKFRNNDVLVAKITPCLENGKTAYVDILDENEVAFGSTEFIVLRPKEGIDSNFLYYLAISPTFRKRAISCMEGTSGRKRVNESTLKLYDILLPQEKQQKKIANVLLALDKKIELNNRINAELEAMAKTLYDYWFVQFDFPNEEGKPYKSSGGKMVYNTTLKREIPEGWRDGIIEEVLDKVPHTIKVLNKNILRSGKYPVVDQGQEYICGFTDTKESVLEVKDAHIIFGDHTTIVKLVNFDYSRGADGTQILISKEERIPNYLLYQMVNNLNLTRYGYARHFKFLKEAKIILPMINISNKYNEIVIPIYEKWRHNFFENINLSELRDFLLPMLMNGQVTVK